MSGMQQMMLGGKKVLIPWVLGATGYRAFSSVPLVLALSANPAPGSLVVAACTVMEMAANDSAVFSLTDNFGDGGVGAGGTAWAQVRYGNGTNSTNGTYYKHNLMWRRLGSNPVTGKDITLTTSANPSGGFYMLSAAEQKHPGLITFSGANGSTGIGSAYNAPGGVTGLLGSIVVAASMGQTVTTDDPVFVPTDTTNLGFGFGPVAGSRQYLASASPASSINITGGGNIYDAATGVIPLQTYWACDVGVWVAT